MGEKTDVDQERAVWSLITVSKISIAVDSLMAAYQYTESYQDNWDVEEGEFSQRLTLEWYSKNGGD